MKSVILGISPDAQIVDLCHDVPAQNVLSGSHILATAVPFLPEQSIVVAVVDPGVGTRRRAIAVQTERNTFIAPDNGLLTEAFDVLPPTRAVELDIADYHLPRISQTFHGRDIFSPCAAHLAAGVDFEEIGTPIEVDGIVRLPEIGPLISEEAIECRVVHIDHFGNAITNLRRETVEALGRGVDCVKIHGDRAAFATTFADVAETAAVCYFNSTDYLELSVRNGSAAEQFEVEQRDMLHVITTG
jgi:S-adenosylmethionine hydrolase